LCLQGWATCQSGRGQGLEKEICRGRRVAGDGGLGEFKERPGEAAEVAGPSEHREGSVEQLPRRVVVALDELVAGAGEVDVRKFMLVPVAGGDAHAVLDHLYLDGTRPQITAPAEDYLRESASPYTLPPSSAPSAR
jgi:hypothetical protein